MNEVVEKMTSSNHSQAIEYHGDVIAERLNQVQTSTMRKSVEEHQKLKEERDEAVKKVCCAVILGSFISIHMYAKGLHPPLNNKLK